MFKRGIYTRPDGDILAVYVIETSTSKRIDICKKDSQFHIDYEGILYSYYKRGKTEYIYGNRELYSDFMKVQNDLYVMKLGTDITTDIKDGKFTMFTTCGADSDCFYRITQVNGETSKQEFSYMGSQIALHWEDNNAYGELAPLTLKDYTKVDTTEIVNYANLESAVYPLSELMKRYNIKHLFDKNFIYVGDVEAADKALEDIKAHKGLFKGFDTETTGVDVNMSGKDRLTGIIVSTDYVTSYYFPFRQGMTRNLPITYLSKLMAVIMSDEKNYVAHLKKFDRKVMIKEGYDLRVGHDSYLVSVLNDPRQRKGLHALKTMEEKRSGKKYLELQEIFIDPKAIDFSLIPDEDLIRLYACPDSSNAVLNYEDQLKKLPKRELFILEVEEKMMNIIADQEYWGVRVDMDTLKKGKENTEYCLSMLENIIHKMLRKSLKLTSGTEVGLTLYDEMHCPVLARTSTGKPSTGSATLKKLAGIKKENPTEIVKENITDKYNNILVKKDALNASKYPIIHLLLAHKDHSKLNSAFYNRIVRNSVAGSETTKKTCYRYYFWVNGNGAESGRQSSPLHQLPPQIKNGILSDSEDHWLVDTDYAQVELRMVASLAKEKSFIDKCKDPNADIHRVINSLITGKEVWEISKEMRQAGKRRNFGVVYDISGKGLAVQEYGPGPTKSQVKEQEEKIREFDLAFPRIKAFKNRNVEETKKHGKIETFFGRIRYFPEVLNPETLKPKLAAYLRQANNLPVQGTSADLLKMATVQMDNKIREKGWNKLVDTPQGRYPLVRCMLGIHDELMVSAHKSIPLEEILELQRDSMEIEIQDFAPFFAESSVAPNWGIGHGDSMKICRSLREKLIEDYKRTGISAFSQEDIEEGYKQVKARVDKFADENLSGYLEGLLAKYGETAQTLKDYVRHASLTHEFIERFPQSAEHKKKYGVLTHIERINYAAEAYMEFRKSDAFHGPHDVIANNIEEQPITEEKEMDLTEILEETTALVEIDREGNPIYDEGDDEEDVCDDAYWESLKDTDEEVAEMNKEYGLRTCYVWKLFDTIILNLTGLSKKQSVDVLNYCYKNYNDPEGFYAINFQYTEDKLQDAKFRVEKMDVDAVSNYIKEMVENG